MFNFKYVLIAAMAVLPAAAWAVNAPVGRTDLSAYVDYLTKNTGLNQQQVLDILYDRAEPEPEELISFVKGGGSAKAAPVPPAPENLGGDGVLTLGLLYSKNPPVTAYYRNADGTYNIVEIAKLDEVMGCPASKTVTPIPVKLYELLDAIEDNFRAGPVIIHSAYRSPKLNSKVGGVKGSLHTLGWAADIHIESVTAFQISSFAKKLNVGGVGYYPKRYFTHVDIGSARYWKVN